MAKFLDTTGVSYHLQQLVNKTTEKLILISPFLKINGRIKQSLEDKNRLKIDIRVVYGKNELLPSESDWLESMTNIRLSYCKDLHAKCYLNESEAIITSMNLYEFSEVNNNEMGILVNKEADPDLYREIHEEAQRLIRGSIDDTPKEKKNKVEIDKKTKNNSNEEYGFCIRTGIKIPFNIEKPLSHDAYKAWNKYGDANYPEKFCHFSGEASHGETTVNKPILKKNWKKAKEIFQLSDLSY